MFNYDHPVVTNIVCFVFPKIIHLLLFDLYSTVKLKSNGHLFYPLTYYHPYLLLFISFAGLQDLSQIHHPFHLSVLLISEVKLNICGW